MEKSYTEVNMTAMLNDTFLCNLQRYIASCYQDFCKFHGEKSFRGKKPYKTKISLEVSRDEFIKRRMIDKYDELVIWVGIMKKNGSSN